MINQEEIFSQLNEGMLAERSRSLKIILKKNLPLIRKWGGLSPVVESFTGKHVLVIGSGPSLDDCYEILKKLRSDEGYNFYCIGYGS